jgi:hypothetical protein
VKSENSDCMPWTVHIRLLEQRSSEPASGCTQQADRFLRFALQVAIESTPCLEQRQGRSIGVPTSGPNGLATLNSSPR